MKNLILSIATLLVSTSLYSQCYTVDTIINHSPIKEVAGRPVTFGVQPTLEHLISNKYSLCDTGQKIRVEINTIGMPEQLVNIIGMQFLKRTYSINISTTVNNITHYSLGTKTVFVNAMFLTVEEIPHNKKAFSKAVESCLVDLVKQL